MGWFARQRMLPAALYRLFFIAVGMLFLIARGSDPVATTAPTAPTPGNPAPSAAFLAPVAGTPTPGPETTPAPTPTSRPSPTDTPALTPTPLPPKPLQLEIISPLDNAGVEAEAVRVTGTTSGITVGINGLPVVVAEDGSFQRDLLLQRGVNLVEVVASDAAGRSRSQQIVVFSVAPTPGLPFTLIYPPDGLEVKEPSVTVMGVTTPDAVVGVNEIPVDINELGIFSATVPLENGANLIEIVAADIEGNVRFQTVVVFYEP